MDKRAFLVFAVLLLALGSASASTVTRSFSATAVAPSASVIVTLTVDVVGNETYSLIEEGPMPSGWQITNPGIGSNQRAGYLTWNVIEGFPSGAPGPSDTTYTYVISAPAAEGTYSFTGKYGFDSTDPDTPEIGGNTQVTVSSSICPQGEITSSCTCGGQPYGSGYCCSGVWQTAACTVPVCSQGIITSTCLCGGVEKSDGYCCSGIGQNFACDTQDCEDGLILETCFCGDQPYDMGEGYCCSGQHQAVECGLEECSSAGDCMAGELCCEGSCVVPACGADLNCGLGLVCEGAGTCNAACVVSTACTDTNQCSTGQLCCNGACKRPACGASVACGTYYECVGPDTCNARCNYVTLKEFSVEAPEYLVMNKPFTVIVKDSDGNPVEGATVTYAGVQKSTGTDGSVEHMAKKGQYIIKVEKAGFKTKTIKRSVKASGTTPGPGNGGTEAGDVTIDVPDDIYEGEEFVVIVTDLNGSPVEGVLVSYGDQSAETDADGRATLVGKRGIYVVRAGTSTLKVIPKKPVVQTNDNNGSGGNGPLVLPPIDLVSVGLIVVVVAGAFLIIRNFLSRKA